MIISIASQKGGVGKSSTSISLAAGLARKGKKVLLIDIDSQANSSKVMLDRYTDLPPERTLYNTIINKGSIQVHPTKVTNLDLVPAHILLSETDVILTSAMDRREERLKRELDQVKEHYDFIIIDNPPALGWLTINAFTASDRIIVVVSPGYFELDSIVQISKTINLVKDNYNPKLELLGFLFTMSDQTINTATSLQILRQTYTSKVFNTVIPRNVDIRDASFNKQDIFSFNNKSTSAQAYDRLIKELFEL